MLSIQDINIDINLNNIKQIFFLSENNYNVIDTILIVEEKNRFYQLYFDENILFMHQVNVYANIYILYR